MISRERILEAAARVYAKHGFRGATTRLIAIEAGVNEVTLFRTFGSKGALLEAVLGPHCANSQPIQLPADPKNPEAELIAFVQASLDSVREMRPLLVHTMGEIEERPEAAEFACRGRRLVHDTITGYLRRLQHLGMANPDADVDAAAVMLTGTVMSDAIARSFVPEVYPPLDEAAGRYVRCFLQMMGVKKAVRRGKKRALALGLLLAVLCPAIGRAQQPAAGAPPAAALSLDEAIRLATHESEALQIARAGITRASGQLKQARSQYLPQLNSNLAYSRTLRSQFSALSGGSSSDSSATTSAPKPQSVCAPRIDANATPAERAAALAQASTCAAVQGIDFSKVGFGARNQYTFGLALSQSVYSGGRVAGQTAAADAQQRSAQIDLGSQRAQLALDVTQAYFDAVLADRLVVIADTSLAQTEELLRQTRVARQVGNLSEFDLLRATVSRDNQRPVLITRRGDRAVAYLRLQQLLNLPLDAPLLLTTPIDEPAAITSIIAANATLGADAQTGIAASDTSTARRAPVRQSEEAVRAQEGQLKSARADLLPSFSLTSNYQRLFFPSNVFPSLNQFSENWTVGGSINFSLFSGGRVAGQVEVAQANLDESRARLQQAKELAALDTRVALNQLQAAEASFEASRGTAQQAQRAYSIDQLRYREGISTQTDLTQSRLLLEQAVANRALSARDLAVARARMALIRDLPINANALGAAAQRSSSPQQPAQPQQSQQQRTQSTAAGSSGAGPIGSPTP